MTEKFPQLDALVYWTIERDKMRQRREAGETASTDDEILATYRFCNPNVQDDRVSRFIFDTITQPYAGHPGLIVGLTVCRFTNDPDVIEAVKDCIVPFDPQRWYWAYQSQVG
jgi:5-hmdU DNA kinase, helical domain